MSGGGPGGRILGGGGGGGRLERSISPEPEPSPLEIRDMTFDGMRKVGLDPCDPELPLGEPLPVGDLISGEVLTLAPGVLGAVGVVTRRGMKGRGTKPWETVEGFVLVRVFGRSAEDEEATGCVGLRGVRASAGGTVGVCLGFGGMTLVRATGCGIVDARREDFPLPPDGFLPH